VDYDPLQARNAHLNLRRLGAEGTEFLENLYGITTSPLHHGLPTDRLLVRWDLASDRVAKKARGARPAPRDADPAAPARSTRSAGKAVGRSPRSRVSISRLRELLLEIPPDWDVLCQAAPRVAEGWHGMVRRAFVAYCAASTAWWISSLPRKADGDGRSTSSAGPEALESPETAPARRAR
jgi:predicted GNAT superfamily acetyltransferase